MSYLSEKDVIEIADTVSIFSITSVKEDIKQYSFSCGKAEEYVTFFKEKALDLEEKSISKTFVLVHNKTKELIGYFSLSTDAVRLTMGEKEESNLSDVVFMSLPAIKLGKLAINKKLSPEASRRGYGSFILDMINTFAYEVNKEGVACRFVTVDADIEYDPNTPLFYEKNGFVNNLSNPRRKNSKTVSMRRDIFFDGDIGTRE